jgi:hypothetical protein
VKWEHYGLRVAAKWKWKRDSLPGAFSQYRLAWRSRSQRSWLVATVVKVVLASNTLWSRRHLYRSTHPTVRRFAKEACGSTKTGGGWIITVG